MCSRSRPERSSTFPTATGSTTTSFPSRRHDSSTWDATPWGTRNPCRFDRAGVVRVFCDIHSHMNAFILVFSHPFYSLTDNDGRYRIDNVPPGSLQRHRLERRRLFRGPSRHRSRRRGRRTRLHAAMTIVGSLRGRIFFASALLAVLSCGDRSLRRQQTGDPGSRARAAARHSQHRRDRRSAENDAHRDVHHHGPADRGFARRSRRPSRRTIRRRYRTTSASTTRCSTPPTCCS